MVEVVTRYQQSSTTPRQEELREARLERRAKRRQERECIAQRMIDGGLGDSQIATRLGITTHAAGKIRVKLADAPSA